MAGSPPKVTRRDFLRYAAGGTATAALGICVGDCTERVQLESYELRLPRWDAEGFRVAVISDLHMDSPARTQRAIRALRMAAEQKTEAILIPGDLLTLSDGPQLQLLGEFLTACRDVRTPIFATLGNHDYWTTRPEHIVRDVKASSIRLLRNEIVEVQGVSIAGIDDALMSRHRPEVLNEAYRSNSLLAMLHEPDYVADLPEHTSLMVAGHSHGGQVCLPVIGSVHTPKGARKFKDGFYPQARVPLFVSRGIGTTGPDFRLYCPPQVAVLTLRKEA